MRNAIWSRLGWPALVGLVVGLLIGGGVVYALTSVDAITPVAGAQGVDADEGVVVADVVEGEAAAEAGVVRGDILLAIDGQTLEAWGDLLDYLDGKEPGDVVQLEVLHGDEVRTLTATLGEQAGRAYLGLVACGRVLDIPAIRGRTGALIVEVVADSPAEAAGLQEGDLIVAVDGQEIDWENGLGDLVAAHAPGDTVTLEVERADEDTLEVSVELGQHPEEADTAYLGVRFRTFPYVGVFGRERMPLMPLEELREWIGPLEMERLRDLPLGLLEELPLNLPEVDQGVIVFWVAEDSPAEAAGLQRGNVITAVDGDPIESAEGFSEAIAARKPGDVVTLTVYRLGEEGEQEVEVQLGEHPDEPGTAYLGVSTGMYFKQKRTSDGTRFGVIMPHMEMSFSDLPFDVEEMPLRFQFQWSSGGDVDDGCWGCSDGTF